MWEIRYNTGVQGSISQGRFVRVDGSGSVLVAGMTIQPFVTSDYVTIKYSQVPTSVDDQREMPSKFVLEQNYPNPFNPSTNIRFQITEPGLVLLRVFNLLGQEVATLVNEELRAGSFEVKFKSPNLATGLYFYKLQSGSLVQIRTMLLTK
jgi:hypothetical protein